MSLSPVIRLPLADMTGAMTNHQWNNNRCGPFENRLLDCLEAYGLTKGLEKCHVLMQDFGECSLRLKEKQRNLLIREERERQYKAGERTRANRYEPAPVIDSY